MTVWASDEARVGLQPITRRVWAPVGCRPRSCGRPEYAWEYVYSFVEPASGQSWFFLWTAADTDLFLRTLDEFARDQGLGPDRHAIVLLDGAGYHTCLVGSARLPVGLHLVLQPPHSRELQPAERLWPLVREALANRTFASLAALELALIERCRELHGQAARLASTTGYDWWLEALGQAVARWCDSMGGWDQAPKPPREASRTGSP